MKRLIALLVICMLCLTTAYAAEWKEGLSPAKPYSGVPEVDLNDTMGYIMLYPRTKMPAPMYCDVLQIYLPREDIELGEGALTLYDEDGEVEKIPFNSDAVEVLKLNEEELEGLMWGSGVCIEIHLTQSLRFDRDYHVLMEESCFTAAEGAVKSIPITNPEAWTPVVNGDFGVSGMFYSAPVEVEEGQTAPEGAVGEIKRLPEPGDVITFDLVMGGSAKKAIVYSDNGSADFEFPEYMESCTISGVITNSPLSWGVAFIDASGELLDAVMLSDNQ